MAEYEPTQEDKLFETRLVGLEARVKELRDTHDPLSDVDALRKRQMYYALSKLEEGNFDSQFATLMAWNYQVLMGASITPATLVVASATSKNKRADYYCDGVADQAEINAAIQALPLLTVYEGQAVGGGSNYVTLPSTVTAEPYEFAGDTVEIIAGTGAGRTRYAYIYSDTLARRRRLYLIGGLSQTYDSTTVVRISRRAGKVVLLDGAYYLTNPVIVPSGATIEGQGPESTMLVMSAETNGYFVVEAYNGFDAMPIGWVQIRGIGIHCHGELYPWVSGIGHRESAYEESLHHSLIENCNVYYPNGYAGIQLFEDSYRTTIRGCRVYGGIFPATGSGGLESEGSGIGIVNGYYNIIENCVVNNCEEYGIVVERNSKCNIVRNNFVERNGYWGLYVGAEGTLAQANIVRANWMGGILVDDYGAYNAVIENIVRDEGAYGLYGIFIHDDDNWNFVANNDLYLSSPSGAIFNHLVYHTPSTSFGAGNRLNDGSWSTTPDGV